MQQVDDPPSLAVGTEVSAKYKGAFCEAKVSKVVRNIKVKVAYKHGLGSGIVSDELIKTPANQFRVGSIVEVRHPERKDVVEATVTKIQDCSQYTVVFDDGDITTLRRTALCLKSGRHFNESETLDQLPLTHPEHFGNPVVGGRRGRRRGQANEQDSSDEEVESDAKEIINEKEEHIGKVVCVEMETKKKDKEKFFPGLVVAPTAQATVRIRVKDDYLVRSFKDGRYYTVPKKEATEFTRETAAKQDSAAVQAALEYLDKNVLPTHWDRDVLFGLRNSSTDDDEAEVDSDSSDDEPREEKDRFVAQLYKYMDDRGTPLNKVPTIQNRDVDLYRLFRAVQKRGGYNRVTAQNQWKSVAARLGFTPLTTVVANLVKQSYKKFLQPYGDFNRKLGCSMLMTPRNSNRGKGRSLVRALSVASPKCVAPVEQAKDVKAANQLNKNPVVKSPITTTTTATTNTTTITVNTTPATTTTTTTMTTIIRAPSGNEESECNSESSQDLNKKSLQALSKSSSSKVKALVDKFEEKKISATTTTTAAPVASTTTTTTTTMSSTNDDNEMPLSKMKALNAESLMETKNIKLEVENLDEKNKIHTDIGTGTGTTAATIPISAGSAIEEKQAIVSSNENIRNYSTSETRDPSPSGSIVSTITVSGSKRDSVQRKLLVGSLDEKRKRRPKQKVCLDKVDVGDFVVEVGDKLKVYYHEKKVTYEAKVIEIAIQNGIPMYMVHYTGWNIRYDEWVPRERIAEKLNKGSKHKKSNNGSQAQEKNKVNPPKPPNAAVLDQALAATFTSGSGSVIGRGAMSSSLSRRGRGRSEQRPTRSATPSSSSSRTKSVTVKHRRRPVRMGGRRVSMTVSDVSLPTESETDSDEPVKPRVTTRGANKDLVSDAVSNKGSSKQQASTSKIKVDNSASETGEEGAYDDEDDDENGMGEKGRDYDLNQIRSELKGFQDLKSESPNELTNKGGKKPKIEQDNDNEHEHKNVTTTKMASTEIVNKKSLNSDLSSETDCFPDDDSQSSDRTTQLQNMTKKFQQNVAKTQIVEKILKESLAEKRKEGNKVKIVLNMEKDTSKTNKKIEEDNKKIKKEDITTTTTNTGENVVAVGDKLLSRDEIKPPITTTTTATLIPTPTATANLAVSNKEYLKATTSPAAAASPTSSVSSISSISSHISFGSTRSIPDMSKLNISSASSTTSSSLNLFKDAKLNTTVTTSSIVPKSISPDIYEFKDTEPFEFELRKSPLVSSTNNNAGSLTARRQTFKTTVESTSGSGASSGCVLRKKRNSPQKEMLNTKFLKTEITTTATTTLTTTATLTTPISTTTTTAATTTTTTTGLKPATAFDDLRKSPSFNLINALNEELAQTVQETIRALTDVGVPASPSTPPVKETVEGMPIATKNENIKVTTSATTSIIEKDSKDIKLTTTTPKIKVLENVISDSAFIETGSIKEDVNNVFEATTSNSSSKFGLEKAKILLSATVDGGFDLMSTPLPENKPDSIADKLLKAINQKKEEDTKMKIKIPTNLETTNNEGVESAAVGVGIKTEIEANDTKLNLTTTTTKTTTTTAATTTTLLTTNAEIVTKFSDTLPKVILPDATKLALLDGNTAKNTELNETIQKLECAIQRKACRNLSTSVLGATNFSEDSIGSTDSERKLIIEDPASEDVTHTQNETNANNMNTVPILLPEIPATVVVAAGCQKNINCLNATNKEFMQIVTTDCSLMTNRNESDDMEMFTMKNQLSNVDTKSEQNVLGGHQLHSNIHTDSTHTDSINLLCEETIPGSPAPVVLKEELINVNVTQQQQQQQQQPQSQQPQQQQQQISDILPKSPDSKITTNSVYIKREQQQQQQQQQQQKQQQHQSSPNDSASQDENHDNSLSRKRRRTRKTSEIENGQNQDITNKRRRILSSKKQAQGGSDSDEALESLAAPRIAVSTRNQQIQQQLQPNYQENPDQISSALIRPCPYNFLVQLDPQLSSDQCITILMKQIQELKKTYNDIKSDLATIDRRRKKIRRRDREKKQNQNQQPLTVLKVAGVS